MGIRRGFFRFLKLPPRLLYGLGLGPMVGRVVLLLGTRGRRTGRMRVTPLQYERIGQRFVVGAARGMDADWVRNVLADPAVEVRVGNERLRGVAEVEVEAPRIADFLELRLRRHRTSVGLILRLRGVRRPCDGASLERYAAGLAIVTITPHRTGGSVRSG